MLICCDTQAEGEGGGVTHTGDWGDDFTYSKTKRDITDLVSRYACLQEDVKREGTDLGGRQMLVWFYQAVIIVWFAIG